MIPSRPYLVKAIYEWLSDNELTPYLMVDASHAGVQVPQAYVEDDQIILNISNSAVHNLHFDEHGIGFTARFSGKAMSVYIPMPAALALYAAENGKGMVFPPEEAYHEANPTIQGDILVESPADQAKPTIPSKDRAPFASQQKPRKPNAISGNHSHLSKQANKKDKKKKRPDFLKVVK